MDEKSGRIFKDRSEILYINSRMPEETDLGKLMHDFHCENPDDMYCEPISRRVRKIKESPEEVEHMCKEMDRIYNYSSYRTGRNGMKYCSQYKRHCSKTGKLQALAEKSVGAC